MGTEHELKRLRADKMLDSSLFTFRDREEGGSEEVISE